MTDIPSPKEIVTAAYERILEANKDKPEELKKAIKGDWNIRPVLEEKLGGSLDDIDTLFKIPTLNKIQSLSELEELNGHVVRFSGFVQDMIDQDFFVGFFMTKPNEFETAIPNKYHYLTEEELKEVDDQAFEHCQTHYTMNRGNLICTSIPNENKWLREKRGIDEGNFDEVAELCVVKLYDDILDSFKMNGAYEFIGTLEYRPLTPEEREERAELYKQNGYLPPNVIPDMDKYPIIHTMTYMPHPYKNATKFNKECPVLDSDKIAELRGVIFNVMVDLYGGDELAAEYVLLSLLSSVQKREDGIPVGISCINLYSTEPEISKEVVKGTERLMKLLQQHTFYTEVDLDSLSNNNLIPKKDYDTNRLSRGGLQLLSSTSVLLDETNMQEGKSEGERLIQNMRGIASLIEEQAVRYNFQYHEQVFNCSCAVIIVSTGRSIFKNAQPVPIYTTRDPNPDALNALDEKTIDELRVFFNQVSRMGAMDIPEECSTYIQDKYVQYRQDEDKDIQENKKDTKEVGAKTLHTWLTLARLKVVSHGLKQCSTEIIDHVVELEKARTKRVTEILTGDKPAASD